MTFLSDMRHAHQMFLNELEQENFKQKLSEAELTTLCLIPEMLQKKITFQKKPLLKTQKSKSAIMEFLRNYSWKGQSDRIRRSIYYWHEGHYPLVLWDQIPTPLELLKIQAEGKRVITVFKKSCDWKIFHHGKSAWDFTVHDLIHADHFFQNCDLRFGQIEFYQFILKNWNEELVVSARQSCLEQFNYLIADMNSHPKHLYQTFSAICLMAWKNKIGIDLKSRLPKDEEALFQSELNHLLINCLSR